MCAAYAAGLPRVRELLCQKLENILLNNKIREVAQEALAYCCANIQPNESDNISLLIGIRWRQKPPRQGHHVQLIIKLRLNVYSYKFRKVAIIYSSKILNSRILSYDPVLSYYLESLLLSPDPQNFSMMMQRMVYAEFEANRNNQSSLAIIQFFLLKSENYREITCRELARWFTYIFLQFKTENPDGTNQFLVIMQKLRSFLREIAKISKVVLA